MMRSILVGILVLMAAGVGLLTFDWYRQTNSGEPYGAPFALVDQKGAPITEAAFRGHPSAVFFGFTHCPEVCPTTLFELDGWLKKLGDEGKDMRAYFVSVDPERDTAEVMDSYVSNVSDRITGITGEPDKVQAMAKAFGIYCAQGRPRRRRLHDGPHRLRHPARQRRRLSPAPSPMGKSRRRARQAEAAGRRRLTPCRRRASTLAIRQTAQRRPAFPGTGSSFRGRRAADSPSFDLDEAQRHQGNLALRRRRRRRDRAPACATSWTQLGARPARSAARYCPTSTGSPSRWRGCSPSAPAASSSTARMTATGAAPAISPSRSRQGWPSAPAITARPQDASR